MNIKAIILNILYSLVLPFHILNTFEFVGLKLYHIPVLLLAVINIFNIREYLHNKAVKKFAIIGLLSLIPVMICEAKIDGFFNYMLIVLSLIGLPYINKRYFYILTSILFLVANIISFHQSEWLGGPWRYQGLYNDPNYLVISMIVGIYICIRVISAKNLLTLKIIAVLSIFIALYATLLSQSRGGIIALFIFFIVNIPELYKRNKMVTIVSLITLIAFSGTLYVKFSENIDNVTTRFRGDNAADSGGALSRITEIDKAFEALETAPHYLIFGAGISASSNNNGAYKNDHRIHNTLIALLYENGLLSLLLFLSLSWYVLKYTYRFNKLSFSLALALLLQCMTIWTVIFFPFWLGLLLTLDDIELS